MPRRLIEVPFNEGLLHAVLVGRIHVSALGELCGCFIRWNAFVIKGSAPVAKFGVAKPLEHVCDEARSKGDEQAGATLGHEDAEIGAYQLGGWRVQSRADGGV